MKQLTIVTELSINVKTKNTCKYENCWRLLKCSKYIHLIEKNGLKPAKSNRLTFNRCKNTKFFLTSQIITKINFVLHFIFF